MKAQVNLHESTAEEMAHNEAAVQSALSAGTIITEVWPVVFTFDSKGLQRRTQKTYSNSRVVNEVSL